MSIITAKEALKYGTNELKLSNIPTSRLDAELLLCFVLGISREKIISEPNLQLTTCNLRTYKKLITKRAQNYPIAYLTNHKEFYGIDFYVNESVLVPRPETELIVEEVLGFCRGGPAWPPENGRPHRVAPTNILEIGTGSGCISLTLAKYLPKVKITAVDISEKALAVAKINKKAMKQKNNVTIQQCNNVHFKKSDLLSNIKSLPDIIIANLPYLTRNELRELSITKEPRLALYGGEDGLEIYEKLFKQIKNKLNNIRNNLSKIRSDSHHTLFIEINPTQKNKITKIIKSYFPSAKIEVKKDLAKRDRVVIIEI